MDSDTAVADRHSTNENLEANITILRAITLLEDGVPFSKADGILAEG